MGTVALGDNEGQSADEICCRAGRRGDGSYQGERGAAERDGEQLVITMRLPKKRTGHPQTSPLSWLKMSTTYLGVCFPLSARRMC